MATELVLIIGGLCKSEGVNSISDIPLTLKTLFKPNRIHHVICVGNIGSKSSLDFFKRLGTTYTQIKGDKDDVKLQDSLDYAKIIDVKGFNLGVLYGDDIPVKIFGDDVKEQKMLIQKAIEMDVDVLLYGYTNRLATYQDKENNKLYINPGSLIGADTIVPMPNIDVILKNWVRNFHQPSSDIYRFPVGILRLIINFSEIVIENEPSFSLLTVTQHQIGVYNYRLDKDGQLKVDKLLPPVE